MGVIGKQSLQSSFFIYIGFAIGALNTLVLFQDKHYFTLDEFGLTKILVDVATLIAMLCTLGTSPAIVKFYPFYSSYLPPKKNDLPVITFFVILGGCLLFILLAPFLKGIIVQKYGARSPLFVEHFNLIYPLTISMAFLYMLESFSWALRKTVLASVSRELVVRVLTTVIVVLLMVGLINFNQLIKLYSLIYIPPVLILLIYLVKSGDLSFHFTLSSVTKRLKKRIIVFSLFIFSGQILNILAKTLDSIIITGKSPGGLADTGIFTIATYFIALMEVPVRSMTGITFAVLSQAWKDKNLKSVFNIYRKTALNLLIAGLGILGVVLLCVPGIISWLGPRYQPMAEVVVILGFSKLIDLGTGLNSHLLLSSKHWKIEFTTNIFLVFMAAIFNFILVQRYGIIGSAWATLIAFTTYNAVRFLLIWKLFDMQPFSKKNLWAIFFAAVAFAAAYFIPKIQIVLLDMSVRSTVFMVIYGLLTLRFSISEDVNSFYNRFMARIKGYLS